MTKKTNQDKTISEAEQIRILSKASPELLKIVGKHSTLWNYSKMETVEKIADLIKVGEAQALEWVEKEVIGKDKDYSDGDKFERNFGEARNELRARQRQLIKQRKDL